MSPRIENYKLCPHCKTELEGPTRVCPKCGGSLQKRFLKAGCLTSAPPLFLAAAALAFGAARVARSAPSEVHGTAERSLPGPAVPGDAPSESTPSLQCPLPPSR